MIDADRGVVRLRHEQAGRWEPMQMVLAGWFYTVFHPITPAALFERREQPDFEREVARIIERAERRERVGWLDATPLTSG